MLSPGSISGQALGLIVMFWRLQARVLMFNRLRAVWSKDYQRESLGKSQWNGDYFGDF